jgi:Mrp family chromosome partitioning ATPase
MPMEVFLGEQPEGRSAAWLRGRLEQLRLDFDYTLLHAPAAGWSSEAALLGNMCDGVILVIEAGSTRRLVAQKVKAMLQAANARLLGTVLTERTFPIPEGIYRKL